MEESKNLERRLLDWLIAEDDGTSSRTIAQAMTGLAFAKHGGGTPCDAHDFARCVRLLRRFPEWRERLHELGALGPEWARLATHWRDLESVLADDRSPYGANVALETVRYGGEAGMRYAARYGHCLLQASSIVERFDPAPTQKAASHG